MRQFHLYTLCALASILTLGACQVKETWQEEEKVRLSLAGDIEQQNITRATDNGFASGDRVGVWVVNYNGDTPGALTLRDNQVNNARFTFDGSKWTPDYDVFYKDKNTRVDIIGYYPYSSAISSVASWPFEVQEDQSTVSANGNMGGYEASDFLWAKREAVMPTSNAVQLLFQHKMSSVVVTLQEGSGFTDGEFATLSQSVLINNVKRMATINLATGVVSAVGSVSARSTVPAAYGNSFRAIVVPQTVNSAASLFSITLGGVAYNYTEGESFTYLAGKQHNFTVIVDKKAEGGYAVTVNTTVSAWTNDNSSHDFTAREYIVVNVETPGTLGQTLTAAGKNPNAIKYLKVLGTVNSSDFFYMKDNMAVLQGVNMQETIVVGEEIPGSAFENKVTISSFIFPDGKHNNPLKKIGRHAFEGTALSGALVIPEGVEELEYGSFSGTVLSSVSFPSSLVKLGDSSFSGCKSLLGPLHFPDKMTYLGSSAFYNCTNLSGNLILPHELEYIGSFAFCYCPLVGSLVIPPKIKTIEACTFSSCGLNGTLTLPEGLQVIEREAFQQSKFKGELRLPSTLIKIGYWAFRWTRFTGNLVLPDGLISLEEKAFEGCSRLQGVIVIPEGIYSLPQCVFQDCNQLEGIILHKDVASIGANCFNNCFQINSIVSLSDQPPVIASGAFNGVAKDNFTVEVPESAVNDYAYASGWSEFKRIAAHREFSVSRRLFRTLNASESKTLIVRAESGANWSVESKPEWVTVNPASGTGKVDVTVTVNALTPGSGNRDGEVVFLLDGKNYRSRLQVEQYDYTYGDGDVKTEYTHTKGSGIPLVFLGDCYDARDIYSGTYINDTQTAIGHFFDIEPYKSYKDYFDVYIVFGKSEDSGVGSVNTIREAKFGTQYSVTGGTLENNGTEAFKYAKKVNANLDLTQALVVMTLNSDEYGGVTYMWNDGSAIAICPRSSDPYPYDFRGIVQHEAGGHGFGKLADEYIYVNAFINACNCGNPHLKEFLAGKANGWYKNLSESSNRYDVPWSHLIYHPNYANTVDMYEGGYFHTRGIFRSEPNSCMNNNIPYYSAISRQAIVERIKAYAGEAFDLDDFYTLDAVSLTPPTNLPSTRGWSPQSYSLGQNEHHHPVIVGDHPVLN